MSIYDRFWKSLEQFGEPWWKLFLDKFEEGLLRRLIDFALSCGLGKFPIILGKDGQIMA